MLLPVGRSGWAIAAGYLGLLSVLMVPGPLAILCGMLGLREIRRSEGTDKRKYGKGRAWFGLIAGSVGSAFLIVYLYSLLS